MVKRVTLHNRNLGHFHLSPYCGLSLYQQMNSNAVPTNVTRVSAMTRVDCTGSLKIKIDLAGILKDLKDNSDNCRRHFLLLQLLRLLLLSIAVTVI